MDDELWEHSLGSAMGLSQLDDALEVYWAGHPTTTGSYPQDYDAVGRMFDQRRLTRTFVQLPLSQRGPAPTCLQCGARPRVLDPATASTAQARAALLDLRRDSLCAVCLAKRLLSRTLPDAAFPSTVSLARNRLFRADSLSDRRQRSERDCGGREALLERLVSSAEGSDDLNDGMLALRRSLERLSRYYALVVFDGDRMGECFVACTSAMVLCSTTSAPWEAPSPPLPRALMALPEASAAYSLLRRRRRLCAAAARRPAAVPEGAHGSMERRDRWPGEGHRQRLRSDALGSRERCA